MSEAQKVAEVHSRDHDEKSRRKDGQTLPAEKDTKKGAPETTKNFGEPSWAT